MKCYGIPAGIGNAFDGLSLFGPFDHAETAVEWAEQEHQGDDYSVVRVELR